MKELLAGSMPVFPGFIIRIPPNLTFVLTAARKDFYFGFTQHDSRAVHNRSW